MVSSGDSGYTQDPRQKAESDLIEETIEGINGGAMEIERKKEYTGYLR